MSSTQRYISSSPLSTQTTTTKTTPFQQRVTPQKKRIMSVTQTYYLAHKARAKLSTEAARADHDLRLLVGHANLLDSLMLELADAEREQESWFNQSVRGATEERAEKKDRHIQWADAIVEDPEEDWHADDADSYSDSSDSSSEYDSEEEEDVDMADVVSLRRLPSAKPAAPLLSVDEDDDMEEDDLEEDYAQLELVRTSSHNTNSPPELVQHDLDSDSSDDESMPPSPPNTILTFSEKEAKESSMQQGPDAFFLPRKNAPATSIVSAISVY
ncbi:hypothetical protein F5X68DRAFT_48928 [Plectosphaerella plurivora]|uniref:Protein ECM13 n=1 Tax=Plectosphaerella plurivora TaxID=936078 RepID=A0A9P8VKM6_9PEZI|nr:hypothetical protein F5X68DRAFT_48928 [Plectosphaerella plurivora]